MAVSSGGQNGRHGVNRILAWTDCEPPLAPGLLFFPYPRRDGGLIPILLMLV
ncbi:hypothetical protein KCP73_15920 [Salmonella enterica subsp. enterica]|nr:hypothetical protein KCP73_15920 [Salmonella enterica subsp. enterica]